MIHHPQKQVAAAMLAVLLVLLAGAPAAAQPAEYLGQERIPSLTAALRQIKTASFCGERVPLERQDVRERLELEMLLMLWDRAQTILWIKRSGRYFPHIEAEIRRAGMPDDLKFLAVIESGLRPEIGSHKGARGVWQFIRETGRKYGLRIDSGIDERRCIFASTAAALKYLQYNKDLLGSWTLAAAGYNMGEKGVLRDMKEQGVRDYYRLVLPRETERYVLRAVAAKLILTDPARYGFDIYPVDLYPPLDFDRITVRAPGRVHLIAVAKAAGADVKAIKDLNPKIKGMHLSPGGHTLFVPKGSGAGFSSRFAAYAKSAVSRAGGSDKYYKVKRGDTLYGIARKFKVSASTLRKLNKLDRKGHIRIGQRLRIR